MFLTMLLRKLNTFSVDSTLKIFNKAVIRLENRVDANDALIREKGMVISRLAYENYIHERENKSAKNAIAELKKLTGETQ